MQYRLHNLFQRSSCAQVLRCVLLIHANCLHLQEALLLHKGLETMLFQQPNPSFLHPFRFFESYSRHLIFAEL